MKKKFVIFIILLFIVISYIIIKNTDNTKTVLLVGKVIGFEIENYKENNTDTNVVPVSTKKLGTITFIKKETNQFVALGHSSMQNSQSSEIQGNCYEASSIEIDKSNKDSIGQLNASIKADEKIGEVFQDNNYGLFGKIDNVQEEQYQEIQTASRYQVKLGKAEIVINIDGTELKSYDVEIVGIDYIASNKNIKIKVVDEELINKTGGIIQGMSGTPLVQNDKLVGAINYVNIEDSKDAYAIFIDKLI